MGVASQGSMAAAPTTPGEVDAHVSEPQLSFSGVQEKENCRDDAGLERAKRKISNPTIPCVGSGAPSARHMVVSGWGGLRGSLHLLVRKVLPGLFARDGF